MMVAFNDWEEGFSIEDLKIKNDKNDKNNDKNRR